VSPDAVRDHDVPPEMGNTYECGGVAAADWALLKLL